MKRPFFDISSQCTSNERIWTQKKKKKKRKRRGEKSVTSLTRKIEHLHLFHFVLISFVLHFIKKENILLKIKNNTSRLYCSLISFSFSLSLALSSSSFLRFLVRLYKHIFSPYYSCSLHECMSQRFIAKDEMQKSHTEEREAKDKNIQTCTISTYTEEWLLLYYARS